MSQEDAQCGLDWDGRAEAGTPLGFRRFGIWVRWLTPPVNLLWPSGPWPGVASTHSTLAPRHNVASLPNFSSDSEFGKGEYVPETYSQ
jgi:hypothetical protein